MAIHMPSRSENSAIYSNMRAHRKSLFGVGYLLTLRTFMPNINIVHRNTKHIRLIFHDGTSWLRKMVDINIFPFRAYIKEILLRAMPNALCDKKLVSYKSQYRLISSWARWISNPKPVVARPPHYQGVMARSLF